MCAVRAFERYGIGLTVQQLGQQWLENGCGSWGSSEQARFNLEKGIKPPDSAMALKSTEGIGTISNRVVAGVAAVPVPRAASVRVEAL